MRIKGKKKLYKIKDDNEEEDDEGEQDIIKNDKDNNHLYKSQLIYISSEYCRLYFRSC